MKHVRLFPLLASLAMLPGCASLQHAGHASYTVRPGPAGYELVVVDGKEFDGRRVTFISDKDSATLQVVEGESKAFRGQGIAAKGLSLFPVTGVNELLGGK